MILRIHKVLDLVEEKEWIIKLKQRYNVNWDDVFASIDVKEGLIDLSDLYKNSYPKVLNCGWAPTRGFLIHGSDSMNRKMLIQAFTNEFKAKLFTYRPNFDDKIDFSEIFSYSCNFGWCVVHIEDVHLLSNYSLNSLLYELDHWRLKNRILVFGSTNLNKDEVHKSLQRPGRLDQEINLNTN